MDIINSVERVLIMLVPMIIGTVFHELAHGYAAWKLGDPTAKMQGRLSLNPIAHLDPAGSFIFLATAIMGPFAFGWAKPVPINPGYFRNRRMGEIIVSVAGPMANFIIAFLFALILIKGSDFFARNMNQSMIMPYVVKMLNIGIVINVTLGWFNLMPIPPLDGSHILSNILPPNLAYTYNSLGRYSFLLLIILLASGLLGKVLWPLVENTVGIFVFILS